MLLRQIDRNYPQHSVSFYCFVFKTKIKSALKETQHAHIFN
uniref:Uncharacterized protein n=1 Tax=Anguilla anguilla TaxID=7936 RepID=A0A0E9XBE0_ANGAN